MRESKERTENSTKVPQQRIADKEELDDYRAKKRKGFEDAIRRNRTAVGNWLKYASWEESQMEMERLVFEEFSVTQLGFAESSG